MNSMTMEHYFVVIVGSGPAGLGVAEALKTDALLASKTLILEKGKPLNERICAVQEGKTCRSCSPCNVLCGIGGAGPFTDGKICLYPQDLEEIFSQKHECSNGDNGSNEEALARVSGYLARVQRLWEEHGVKDFKKAEVTDRMERLQAEALKHNIKYTCYPVLHIGSDGAKEVLDRYVEGIRRYGIKIEPNLEVIGISKTKDQFEITYRKSSSVGKGDTKILADFLVLAMGRDMQRPIHVTRFFKDLKLSFKPKNLEIGCRIEVPYQILEEVTKITFDPKFNMVAPTYQDSVRTFCTCHKGRVVREGSCVNGHIDRTKETQNTNFAILVRWPLSTLLLEDAMDFGITIAKLAISQGKGRPLIQRLGDLKERIPSTRESIEKCYIKPTLRLDRHVTPGDISSCYPTRIIVDILEGLEMLDEVVTGINNDQNLVYAPEIKPTCSINLIEGVKTEVPRLYVCGDFSGYTRGIAQAMSMGILVGEDILDEKKKGLQLRLMEQV